MPKSDAEIGQEQTVMIERLDSLETIVRTLSKQQIDSDKTVERLMTIMEAHLAEESKEDAKYDQTMRNLDETLKRIQLELAGQPSVRSREIRRETDRLQERHNALSDKFLAHKEKCNAIHTSMAKEIKDDMRKEAGRHFKTIYVVVTVCCVLIGALYYDMRGDIKGNTDHRVNQYNRHGGATP